MPETPLWDELTRSEQRLLIRRGTPRSIILWMELGLACFDHLFDHLIGLLPPFKCRELS
jgi:hypothetical protein